MFLATLLAWATMFVASTTVNVAICQAAPSAPTITSPRNNSTTKSQTVTVSGTSSDHLYEIDIYDNGSLVATTTSDSSGKFGVSINLVKHKNQIVARANNKCGATANSSTVTVTLNGNSSPSAPNSSSNGSTPSSSNYGTSIAGTSKATSGQSTSPNKTQSSIPTQSATSGPLKLTVDAPPHDTKKQDSVFLRGSTNKPSKITVYNNGNEIAKLNTNKDGTFGVLVPLYKGVNAIVVIAKDGVHTTALHLEITRLAKSPLLNHFWTNRTVIIVLTIGIIGLVIVSRLTVRLVSAKLLRR